MLLDLETVADVVALAVKDATAPLLERLAVAEAKLLTLGSLDQSVTAIRERVVVAETKIAVLPQPVTPPAVDLSPVLERVKALEGKGAEHDPSVDCRLTSSLVHGLDKELAGLRDRVQAIETKAASFETRPIPPDTIAPALERTDRAVAELAKDVGAMRERVAVVEVRAGTPGPPGKDGQDGKDGSDGMGWDDLSVTHDGERTFSIKLIRGDRVKEAGSFTLPVMIYRGSYQDGQSYEPGDVVTFGGAAWHCQKSTVLRPESANFDAATGKFIGPQGKDHWSMLVKRGRDGRPGKDADAAPATLPVVKIHG